MEGITLLLVCAAPWAFGAVHPIFEGLLLAGVSLVGVLAALQLVLLDPATSRQLIVGTTTSNWDTVCLVAILLLATAQLVPLPTSVLSSASPGAVELSSRLLPSEPEYLANGNVMDDEFSTSATQISLYPAATRKHVTRLLALLMLFAVGRYLLPPGSLRRLAMLAAVNGTALGYFGLAQFFSSQHNVLFWSFESLGTAFGPFINRNHFAFYINICIGLSVGILLSRLPTAPRRRELDSFVYRLVRCVQDTGSLAIIVGLVAMLSGVVLCLSRGGFVAMLSGGAVCIALRAMEADFRKLAGLVPILILTTILLGWLGFDLFESRLASLWSGEEVATGRLQVWGDTLPAALDFLLTGSGLGTFPHLEPLYRTTADYADYEWGYAHNDYLQVLVEGGSIQLLLVLLVIVLNSLRLGWVASKSADREHQALALGITYSWTTMVVHSAFDSGIQIPAIAAFVFLLTGSMGRLPASRPSGHDKRALKESTREFSFLWRIVVVCLAIGLLSASTWIYVEGRRADIAERYRIAALRQPPEQMSRRISLLESAVTTAPENALLHLELARTHFRDWESDSTPHRLVAAQRHFLIARNLCPLLPRPQLWLTANADTFSKSAGAEQYLKRGKILRPFDPLVYYVEGALRFEQDDVEQAISAWRKALALSPRFLTSILEQIEPQASPDMIIQLTRSQPQLMVSATEQLYPDPADKRRKRLLAEAVVLLENSNSLSGEDAKLVAEIHRALGNQEEALKHYQNAVQLLGQDVDLRFDYAVVLRRAGRRSEALAELKLILHLRPDHQPAEQLLKQVAREAVDE